MMWCVNVDFKSVRREILIQEELRARRMGVVLKDIVELKKEIFVTWNPNSNAIVCCEWSLFAQEEQ